ncbi:MAG: VCBS repeat-containing protein [Bacteroidetes bacterium]|nr:VCBS repeat-containing protein [Bacteroidota bacterium]
MPALVYDVVNDVWTKDERSTTDYLIRKYRPRTEGSFIRIERWTKKSDGIIHWRVIKADNTQVVFGKNENARIADPNNDRLIFEWMIDYSFDDSGNFIQYHYKIEDLVGIDSQLVNERNRINENSKVANSYLKSIQYGNTTPYNPSGSAPTDFMFETILDYGECENTVPFDDAGYEWIYRADAFSEYRAGFEIRHARLCKRVILMHYFSQLNGGEAVVKTVDFNYFNNDQSGFTFLQNFIVTGYTKHDTGTYTDKALPPIEFEYQKHEWNTDVKNADPSALEHSLVGLANASYQWIDLYSEGLTGILTEQGNGLYYKQNLGEGKFTPAKLISPKPSFGLSGGMQVTELDANGIKQMGSYSSEPAGYFEINDEEEWQSFHSFQSLPNINFQDPHLKFIDIDGDGLADFVITENDVLRWYKGKGSKGFSESRKVYRELEEEKGCRAVFADMTQSIFIADMNGDGLSDIVRIRHSEVSYWPNMGYGKFGAKVTMNQSPHFDSADHFNPAYLQLSDIDGSGTTDIVYLGNNQCQIYINHQGNGFGETPNIIFPFPSIDNQTVLSLVDYLANGTGCIVWSSSLQKDAHMPMKYIDLMNGMKPHILKKYKNNFGKEVEIEYKVSTKFYTEAKLAGKPWITKLPFPVHCVSKVITYDRIRKLRFASTYSYAHGYYDHIEREFRGFGRVDQYDAETIDHYILNSSSAIEAQDLHQHPVLTRTWFHTGAMVRHQKMLHQFEQEYYQNPSITEYDMPESTIPTGMAVDEYVYAYRALKGTPLRKEVYAMDESADQDKPYLVEQQNVFLKLIQPKLNNKYPVLFSHAQESIVYTYERDMTDPRIAHSFVLEVNDFGMVTKSVNVVYPRLVSTTHTQQQQMYIVYTTVDYTNHFDLDDDYLHPITCQTKTYEVTTGTTSGDYYDLALIKNDCETASPIDYEVTPSTSALNKRVIENVRVFYKDNDGTTPLAYGVLDTKGLVHETYYAAFNDTILDNAFGSKMSLSSLQALVQDSTKGGYVFDVGYYWIPSGTQVFNTAHFYLPTSYIDPFGNTTTVQYDAQYLFIDKTIDALSNTSMIVKFNYRTLAPVIVQDINENLTGVRYDELGMVISSFIIGKTTDLGDVMDQTTAEISSTDEPGVEMTYTTDNWYVQCNTSGFDIDDYMPNPNCVYTKARDIHALDPNAASTKWMESYSYSDGSGGVIMQKTKAEVGDAIIPNLSGTPTTVTNVPRWVGNGRTIVNNKGNAVKQYEPFFSTHYGFEDESEMVQMGVTPVLHYDALGRNIRIDLPDGTFTKVSFTAWDQTSYDQNDTVLDSQWYADRSGTGIYASIPEEVEARVKSVAHANTPSKVYLDTLGRTFMTEVHKVLILLQLIQYSIQAVLNLILRAIH